MKSDRAWLSFVRLALWSALWPGFGLATVMVGAGWVGAPPGLWYLAAIQTHAYALLMGWGAAMIFGVALHFLPRLRGVKLAHPHWVPVLFWCLALGLTVRVLAQPLRALWAPTPGEALGPWLDGATAGGLVLSAMGLMGLLAILVTTFRAGRPLEKNKGFQQIAPLLVVAGTALVLAQGVWCGGAVVTLVQGDHLALLPHWSQSTAVDLMLFGFVPAIGIAMSSRLFPITFRTQLPHAPGLRVAAWTLGGGVVVRMLATLVPSGAPLTAGAAVLTAGGLWTGIFAVRIFHARKPIKNTQIPYRVREDPAGVGVLTAYFWMAVAAALLLLALVPWTQVGRPGLAPLQQTNLSRHALGLGFMTLLILSVGWKMLPGFTGGQPRGHRLLWSAIGLGNLAVILRILPAIFPDPAFRGHPWNEILFPVAGASALAALILFALALRRSFRPPPPADQPG